MRSEKKKNFWGQDAMKGSRRSFKILIVSDMHQTLQHDAKTNWRQFKIAYLQHGFAGEFGACHKKKFQSKNLDRSNQIAER